MTQPHAFSQRVSVYAFHSGEDRELSAQLSDIERRLQEPDTFIWVDIQGADYQGDTVQSAQADDLEVAQQFFGLHPLAIEDALSAHQRAKVEAYNDFLFVVMHAATLAQEQLHVHETALFIGSNYVLTVRHDPTFSASDIIWRWEMVPESWRYSTTSLVYVIFDELFDSFSPLTDELETRLQGVRQQLARGRNLDRALLGHLFNLETVTQAAYGVALTMRDVLPPFMRSEHHAEQEEKEESLVSSLSAPYYRDIHDHAVATVERLGANRDLSVRAFDTYHAMTAQQQNVVSRQLTIVSTIFLPLTFLTGFFGQNFGFLVRHIDSAHAFWWLGIGSYMLSMLFILLIMYYILRRNY